MRHLLARRFVLLVAIVAFVFAPAIVGAASAWARPGGGSSYRSGGGSTTRSSGSSGGSRSGGGYSGGGGGIYVGGGSSSSSGSIGFEILMLLLVGGVVVLYFVFKRKQLGYDSSARDAILAAQFAESAPVTRAVSLDQLRVRDPNLSEADVLRRVAEMSRILKEAWTSGDMRPARPFVSDGIFSRFQVQIALMAQEGLRNVMSDAAVLYSTVEAVESEPPFDVIHVRFTGQARDRMVPINSTPEQIARALASAPLEQYSEIWTLLRRHGAVTKLDAQQIGRACPKCGAPMNGGEMIVCQYCKALVCSGEYDWVLSEITQVVEWHPSARVVDGLERLRKDDPAVASAALEDRASYLFWKWMQASREGTFGRLRKCATASFAQTSATQAQGLASAHDIAVGGSDLLAVDPGEDGGVDYAYVKIYWSASFARGQEPTPAQSILRLMRKAGGQSILAMSALVCRACGAPLTESDTTRCDHCGAEIAAGEQAWVLDALQPPGHIAMRNMRDDAPLPSWLLPNIADPRERTLLFANMAAIVSADGQITRSERRLLRMCAARWTIPGQAVEQILAHPNAAVNAAIASATPQWFLAGLVSAALVDGTVDARERVLLDRACGKLALPREELDRQLSACEARMRQHHAGHA